MIIMRTSINKKIVVAARFRAFMCLSVLLVLVDEDDSRFSFSCIVRPPFLNYIFYIFLIVLSVACEEMHFWQTKFPSGMIAPHAIHVFAP